MYARNFHIGAILSPEQEQKHIYGALEESLVETTKPYETLFNRTYGSEALKEDNETFAIALMDVLDVNGQSQVIYKFGIPTAIGDWTIIKLMAGAALSATANNMNISLRQEFTRSFLDKALVETGVTEARQTINGLGSWLSEAFKDVRDLFGKAVTNVIDFFKNLGKQIGTGLRKFGDGVRRIFQIVYDKAGFARYLLDLVGLTPGFEFIFGSLLREIGAGLETGKQINWKQVAADGSRYLSDMAVRLQVASNFLPPPWNIIAKLVAVVFKAGSYLINDALAKHVQQLMAEEAERQKIARDAFEQALYDEVYKAFDLPMPPQMPSLHGSTGSNKSGAGIEVMPLVFAGIAGFVGLKLLGVLK